MLLTLFICYILFIDCVVVGYCIVVVVCYSIVVVVVVDPFVGIYSVFPFIR